jgi:molybdopterin converting factor small subunit|tara:strand:+ start:518 stop:784 length:267 start_codon:yes stop_codon:yes gene_type:complete
MIEVLLFASAREAAGKASLTITPTPTCTMTTETIKLEIIKICPTLAAMFDENEDSLILALNQEYVLPGQVFDIKDGDEVAVIPPISGG